MRRIVWFLWWNILRFAGTEFKVLMHKAGERYVSVRIIGGVRVVVAASLDGLPSWEQWFLGEKLKIEALERDALLGSIDAQRRADRMVLSMRDELKRVVKRLRAERDRYFSAGRGVP